MLGVNPRVRKVTAIEAAAISKPEFNCLIKVNEENDEDEAEPAVIKPE